MAENKPVVFLNSRGEEISNDPRWHAAKTLKSTGVDVNDLQAQIAKLTAERDEALAKVASPPPVTSIEEAPEDEDEDDDESAAYADVKGADLVKLAKERGIDLKHEDGTKLKAAEVRAALAAQDEAGE